MSQARHLVCDGPDEGDVTVCAHCGRENREGNRYCTHCGAGLQDLPPQPARLQLTWAMGQQDFPLTKREYHIGRDDSNDFILFDPEVSGRHLRLTWKDAAYWIEDLGSRNGTFVNGERLLEVRKLTHGDLVKLGRSILTFIV